MVAPLVFDRVQESATTLGSGNFTLLGAEAGGFRTFSSLLAFGQTVYYCIQNTSQNEWEVGVGTYVAPNSLARTTVLASSNANALISFSAGTKDVFIDAPASLLSPWANTGDLPYLAATGQPTVLPIGSNGFVLTVSGGLPAWAAASSDGSVSSVSNSNGSLTISPTVGAVVASLNVAHANTWTAVQAFNESPTAPFGDGTCERFGYGAGNDAAFGSSNTVVGQLAGSKLTFGGGNTVVGCQAGLNLLGGSSNTIVGSTAASNLAGGIGNTVIGNNASNQNTAGNSNTLVGNNAGIYITGSSNVAVGNSVAGTTLATGGNNVLLGGSTDTAAAGSNYAVALGDSAIAAANEFAVGPNINVQTLYGLSSTSATRARADWTVSWADNTDATRKARFVANVWDTAAREVLRGDTDGTGANLSLFGAGSYGSGRNVVFIPNAAATPSSDPSGGGLLYVTAGALTYRGSGGTTTTIAAADQYCPVCGADFITEFQNGKFGYLFLCLKCLADELGERPWIIRR